MDDADRTDRLRRDVTYGTASEFGFDFLRDRLKLRGGQATPPRSGRRGCRRRTPPSSTRACSATLTSPSWTRPTASSSTRQDAAHHRQPDPAGRAGRAGRLPVGRPLARSMKRDEHFTSTSKKDKIELTDAGRHLVRYSNPPTGKHAKAMDKLLEAVERRSARLLPLRPRSALHDQQREEDRHHRRGHRPADARPALARRAAPGGRGEGRRADQHGRATTRPRSRSRTSTGSTPSSPA